MLKKYFGRNRRENLDWLLTEWLPNGPPVCFLQGFSGVGKTDLARDLRDAVAKLDVWDQAIINEIPDRPNPSVIGSLLELAETLSSQGLPEMERVLASTPNPNLGFAMEKALKRRVLVILDEAQRFFNIDSGTPLAEMNGILAFLRTRQDLAGRVLMLSDRHVETARWSEWIPIRSLTSLDKEEALEVFEDRIKESDASIDASPARKRDIVTALDCNPRAIEALVGALYSETLDEIIGSKPGLWDTGDRVVSQEFLHSLERDLLDRTLKHLDIEYQRKLWHLSVHRRSFKKDALKRVCSSDTEANVLRTILVSRYLINFRNGSLSLNPIVREICHEHLKNDIVEYKQAHSWAADYHLRHFNAKQIVVDQRMLAESFAEGRYHLVQAGKASKVFEIGDRYAQYLESQISVSSPLPTNADDLDERIEVLTVLLGEGGADNLEHYLARCLRLRAREGDIDNALIHAERATAAAVCDEPVLQWMLVSQLTQKVYGDEAAIKTIQAALEKMPESINSTPLYSFGANLLANTGKNDEAVSLLRSGIAVPGMTSPEVLYLRCADILANAGKDDEAVLLLRSGIAVPGMTSPEVLYLRCADILANAGKDDEAVSLIQTGIAVPSMTALQVLYHGCAEILSKSGKADEAVSLLKAGIVDTRVSDLSVIYHCCAKILASTGRAEEAVVLLRAGIARSDVFNQGPLYACCADILANTGNVDDAVAILNAGITVLGMTQLSGLYHCLGDILSRAGRVFEAASILKQAMEIPGMNCASLSGIYQRCVEMIEAGVTPTAEEPLLRSPSSSLIPDVYVSYAWGEDSTESGRKREAIVDRLCKAVENSGRIIGRDKDRLHAGDSIERFAQEMSQAPRIVAVISEKSLHSRFCMVDELYGAWRRCNHQVREFQEKVIALVMDDAKTLIANDLQIAVFWKNQYETEKEVLTAVDPERHSIMRWSNLNQLKEMCPKLPDMIGALKDIVMKRGFDEIVNDGFKEVISRLPNKEVH